MPKRKRKRHLRRRRPKKWSFSQVVEALGMAAPWCLSAHFEEISNCIPASVAGARALQKFGYSARPVVCAVVVQSGDGLGGVCGLTPDEAVAQGCAFPEDVVDSFHVAIWAQDSDLYAFVDLTITQMKVSGCPVPHTFQVLAHSDHEWPKAEFDYGPGVRIEYLSCSRVLEFEKYSAWEGLAEDLKDVMTLALGCGLDRGRFVDQMVLQTNAMLAAVPDFPTVKVLEARLNEFYRDTFVMGVDFVG